MDQQKLRLLVFEKTGVRIDVDDPVFALVALNEAVLAEAVERHVALLDAATGELAAQVRLLRAPAGGAAHAVHPGRGATRMMANAAGAGLVGALLVLFGQALWCATPARQPAALSAAQADAIRNGEKLAKIVQQLEPQTRDKIHAALNQP
ncbi:MAG: hypothetical protein H7335_21355 [Massilia sp.]|nr:hypothetical protein [Massilia sp.]